MKTSFQHLKQFNHVQHADDREATFPVQCKPTQAAYPAPPIGVKPDAVGPSPAAKRARSLAAKPSKARPRAYRHPGRPASRLGDEIIIYLYIYLYIYIFIYTYIDIYSYIYILIYLYLLIYIFINLLIYIFINSWAYISVFLVMRRTFAGMVPLVMRNTFAVRIRIRAAQQGTQG